jgi:DNA-binding Lrp family transcriptional regulator
MMTKNEPITEDEKKVLDALEKNGKESIDDIAKRCEFSRQKVWRIIKHFEENKTIWGYVGIENEEVKGLSHFVLLVKRSTLPIMSDFKKELTGGKIDSMLPENVKIENIYLTHGTYDGVVTFYAPNLVTAKKLIQNISKNLDKLLAEYLLLETLIPIRKVGLKNPEMKRLIELL